jgi:hypothetical protein
MPFKKVNVKEEINKRLENDAELKKAYDCAQYEYEVLHNIKSAIVMADFYYPHI